MNDPPFVRVVECFHKLAGDGDALLDGNGALRDALAERWSLDVLHHQVVGTHVVERADVGVIQRRDRAGLAIEPLAELGF